MIWPLAFLGLFLAVFGATAAAALITHIWWRTPSSAVTSTSGAPAAAFASISSIAGASG